MIFFIIELSTFAVEFVYPAFLTAKFFSDAGKSKDAKVVKQGCQKWATYWVIVSILEFVLQPVLFAFFWVFISLDAISVLLKLVKLAAIVIAVYDVPGMPISYSADKLWNEVISAMYLKFDDKEDKQYNQILEKLLSFGAHVSLRPRDVLVLLAEKFPALKPHLQVKPASTIPEGSAPVGKAKPAEGEKKPADKPKADEKKTTTKPVELAAAKKGAAALMKGLRSGEVSRLVDGMEDKPEAKPAEDKPSSEEKGKWWCETDVSKDKVKEFAKKNGLQTDADIEPLFECNVKDLKRRIQDLGKEITAEEQDCIDECNQTKVAYVGCIASLLAQKKAKESSGEDFSAMTVKQLKEEAKKFGATETQFDACDEKDDNKVALIELVTLMKLTVKDLKKKARSKGVTDAQLENCEEEQNCKAAIVKLLM